MINLLTQHLLSFLKANINTTEDDIEVYKYGIEITISSLLNIIIILILSLIFNNVISGLCFLFCFILLRQFTGGYHAESYFKCNLALAISYLCVLFISNFIAKLPLSFVEGLLIIGLIVVIIFSPVNNKHKPLTEQKKSVCKRVSIIIYSSLTVVSIVLKSLRIYYGAVIALTLLVVALMIIIEIYMQKEGYHES
ncbi:MAG: accessory gene regulator B family protein [Oscillospiraceae bacterium]|nr:accessory gene regulator B family protein [Oscillospiraceae bacterium]